jgi:hypothetical protein
MHIVLMISKGRFSLNCTLDGPQRRNIVRPKGQIVETKLGSAEVVRKNELCGRVLGTCSCKTILGFEGLRFSREDLIMLESPKQFEKSLLKPYICERNINDSTLVALYHRRLTSARILSV